jgi:hypothetical protein
MEAIGYYYYNTANKSLVEGKNLKEIDEYSEGKFDLTPFKRMYKSMKRALYKAQDRNNENYCKEEQINTTGLDWTCLPLIPTKLNSAVSIVHKIPVEVTCTATDPLAVQKKKKDFEFLKNKPKLEADLLPLAEDMGVNGVDLGTTEHGAIAYSESPYGLDLTDPEDADIFTNLIYSLGVEASFETVLQHFWAVKKAHHVKLLEIRDQFKLGVSAHRAFTSSMTGLPDIEYKHPSTIYTPSSNLPDYSDNTHRYEEDRITVMQLFNYFGNEIKDLNHLEAIINDKKCGYCTKNGHQNQPEKNWTSFKVNLIYFEVKSLDWMGVQKKKNSKFSSFTMDESKATEKIWGQNTYGFWWLKNTEQVFGIHKLPYSLRTKGQESFQSFSTNIYKSQEQSCVELSIGENKKAQTADIKLQHAIIKSQPSGKYIDMRFIRGALSALKDETNQWTIEDLINMAFEQNVIIGDTEDFDRNPAMAQLKPVIDLVGGLKLEEVRGYMQVIAQANQNIAQITGINEQLTGQAANPEGLIGMQKLLINSSINALHYCNEAITNQYQALFNLWANIIKQGVEAGGKTKKAIINAIGAKKAAIIDGLEELSLHDIGVKVAISQREEERAKFQERVSRLKQVQIITVADEYMLDALENPKDKIAFLAVKEKLYRKRLDKQEQVAFERQQTIMAQQGEQQQAAIAMQGEQKQGLVFAQGEVQAKLLEIGHQLGLNAAQMDGFIKRMLQADRGKMSMEKSLKTLEAKNNVTNQQAITV